MEFELADANSDKKISIEEWKGVFFHEEPQVAASATSAHAPSIHLHIIYVLYTYYMHILYILFVYASCMHIIYILYVYAYYICTYMYYFMLIMHHTSYIIHHASCIMHHTSYIIHHTSYIIYDDVWHIAYNILYRRSPFADAGRAVDMRRRARNHEPCRPS